MADIVDLRTRDVFGDPANLADIPLMLERLAARLRAGELGDVQRCTVVVRSTDSEPAVMGFGESDSCHAFEDLHVGAAWLLAALDH